MDVIPWLPNTVFGVMAIIGAILCFFLPETLGRPLPQTIHEVEQWSRTLTPEEKRKFKESKEADKEFEKNMKLQALMEEETPEAWMWQVVIFRRGWREHKDGPMAACISPGGRLNIKISFYQYMDLHVKGNTVSRPSYLYNGNIVCGQTLLILKRDPIYHNG